jgi:hypothetical protein
MVRYALVVIVCFGLFQGFAISVKIAISKVKNTSLPICLSIMTNKLDAKAGSS